MNTRSPVLVSLIALMAILLAACGAPAATIAPAGTAMPMQSEPYGYAEPQGMDMGAVEAPAADAAAENKALATAGVVNTGQDVPSSPAAGHMIIKNADMRLLVEDMDVAIDRTTQMVGDLGGYIVSSRTWMQDYYEYELKYASLTIGLPVGQIARGLSRLRGFAIKVNDETASGEDVTDQYVDLKAQLVNLEATRARITTFLEDAQNVDEALRINQQLSEIERQIEQIKGQMNYFQDRSAFSTITVNFEPQLPELVTTPTPTPEPAPWKPGDTFKDAQKTVTAAYQGIVDFLIWFGVVIVPIFLPPVLIVWGLVRLLRRRLPRQS